MGVQKFTVNIDYFLFVAYRRKNILKNIRFPVDNACQPAIK
jgi:hypothetical protein